MLIPILTTPVAPHQWLDTFNSLITQINSNLIQPAIENLPKLAWAASRFYGVPAGVTPGTLLTVTGTLYAYPIYIPGNTPIKTISIDSTTGQTGGALHAGIYTDLNGAPNALVTGSDSGALAATSTAVATATYSTPLNLTAGWYWLAAIATASSTFPTVASVSSAYTNELNGNIGSDTAAHAFAASSENSVGVTGTTTYGALPATFPTASLVQAAGVPLVVLGT